MACALASAIAMNGEVMRVKWLPCLDLSVFQNCGFYERSKFKSIVNGLLRDKALA